jgi:PAS domain S-box-containing protein
LPKLSIASSLSGPRERPGAGLGAGVLTALLVVALDVALGHDLVITTAFILAPFIAALVGGPRETTVVGVIVVALAALSGLWNHDFGETNYLLRLAIVVAGTIVALIAAEGRAREAATRGRFRILMEAARVVDDTLSLQEAVDRLSNLVVPAFADVCIFDLNMGTGLERLKVCVTGDRSAELEELLEKRGPGTAEAMREALDTGTVRLIENLSGGHLLSPDDAGTHSFRMLNTGSGLAVPLRARGRNLGLLTIVVTEVSGRRYAEGDLEFAELLGGRAGLALDNAGLFSELTTAEAELTAALGSLAEAVTVQSTTGGLIYANEAAAESLGFSSAEDLLATPLSEIVDRFESYHPDGTPMRMEDLPGRKVLEGEEPEPMVIRAIDKRTGEERWRVTKATPVRDREGKVVLAVNIIEDITEVKKTELAQRLLAKVGEVLTSSLDYETTLQQVADLAVPDLADWCGVSIPRDDGIIEQVAVAHVDPTKVQFAWELSERYPVRTEEPAGTAAVIRDGKTQVVTDVTDEMLEQSAKDATHLELIQALGIRAGVIVPMTTPGGTIGALTLVTAESGRTFSPADVELAEEIGRRAGAAVENARLYTERSHIARTLQRGLLPPQLPEMPGWAAATLYRPAGKENWVGGDFYDAFEIEDGWMVVVGDVVGHGPGAAALTAEARYTLRTAATLSGSSLVALEQVNRGLYTRDPGMALCTAACVTLRQHGDRCTAEVVCAGHPLPFLVDGDQVRTIGQPGPMLGAWEERDWVTSTCTLGADETLVLYTDGVIDAEGDGERFGETRLRNLLVGTRDANDAVQRIGTALGDFEVGEQADDTAVLAVSRVRVAAPQPTEQEASPA